MSGEEKDGLKPFSVCGPKFIKCVGEPLQFRQSNAVSRLSIGY